jgi:hypothetical protein
MLARLKVHLTRGGIALETNCQEGFGVMREKTGEASIAQPRYRQDRAPTTDVVEGETRGNRSCPGRVQYSPVYSPPVFR